MMIQIIIIEKKGQFENPKITKREAGKGMPRFLY